MVIPTFGMYVSWKEFILISKNAIIMCGMYMINGMHGPERENLWIKSHTHLIKITSRFSGAHFDEKFTTFRMISCIMVPYSICRMARVC